LTNRARPELQEIGMTGEWRRASALAAAGVLLAVSPARAAAPQPVASAADIIAAATSAEWRTLAPDRLMVIDLPKGRVVIELAPDFAPSNVARIRELVRSGYFDKAVILRSQPNYVVQWGLPEDHRPTPAPGLLKGEFDAPGTLAIDPLPDRDTFAPEVGFSSGFPAARDWADGRSWLTHCYGMVGVGRDNSPDSGDGTELYVVTGHAPRQLDRNITLVGRVVQGMELMLAMPFGTGDLGFYRTPAEMTPLRKVRMAEDMPLAERVRLQALRTDSPSFQKLLESRRNRRDPWFVHPASHIDLCNVPLPVRPVP
jgi:peptidylprolyl isomerase